MDTLFLKYDLGESIECWKKKVQTYILDLPPQEIIGVDIEAMVHEIVADRKEFGIILNESNIERFPTEEVMIDVSHDPDRVFFYNNGPHYVKGTKVTFLVPFEGNAQYFDVTPSTRDTCPPRAIVKGNHLEIVFEGIDLDPDKIDRDLKNIISSIKKYLSWINSDLEKYNSMLPNLVKYALGQRLEKIQKDKALESKLKYPIRSRCESSQQTINATPKRKNSPRIQRLLGRNTPLEPAIDMAEYEHILDIIKNMSSVMENSPRAFQTMDEESIRQHFLVQLNGQYEGTATGETFNFNGKTDIIIKSGDRNVFIAECKFWKGESVFLETIDQILSYSGWRDTKTAILLFSKNKDFTSVIQQIPPICRKHPNFITETFHKSETDFRFIFSHKNDPSRRLYLAILAFNIPSGKARTEYV